MTKYYDNKNEDSKKILCFKNFLMNFEKTLAKSSYFLTGILVGIFRIPTKYVEIDDTECIYLLYFVVKFPKYFWTHVGKCKFILSKPKKMLIIFVASFNILLGECTYWSRGLGCWNFSYSQSVVVCISTSGIFNLKLLAMHSNCLL